MNPTILLLQYQLRKSAHSSLFTFALKKTRASDRNVSKVPTFCEAGIGELPFLVDLLSWISRGNVKAFYTQSSSYSYIVADIYKDPKTALSYSSKQP